MFCNNCGAENPGGAKFCRICGQNIDPSGAHTPSEEKPIIDVKPTTSKFTRTQVIGLIGCIFLIIGCFTPLISVPIFGSINYFRNGSGDGVIILVLTLISIIPILVNKYVKILHATGLISLCLIVYDFLNISNMISEFKSKSENFGMFSFLGSSIQMEYGWVFLIIGSILIFIAPFLD